MPSDTIIGRDVLLYFLVNGIYQQAACATECTFNVVTDTVEVTTKTHNQGQGSWRKIKPVFNSWSASVNGIQLLDTPLKFSDIRQMQTDLSIIYIQYAKVSKSGRRYENWFGAGVITETDESAAVDDFAQFSIQIEGYGALTADFDPTNINQPIEMFYYYTATGNEGRSWLIPDLQGFIINGRIYRDGFEQDPSGTETMNRTATAAPLPGQFQWDDATARITLATQDAEPAANERFTFPYTINYNGCSLVINNFKVFLDSNNKFNLSWQGTGLPVEQTLFEYSADNGVTYGLLTVDVDTINLDNAIVTAVLDSAGSYIFRITPICTNQAKGKPSYAYWNDTIATIINNKTNGTLITFITYNDTATTEIPGIAYDATTQLDKVVFARNPYINARTVSVQFSGAYPFPVTITIKSKTGDVLGTVTTTIISSSTRATVSLNTTLPNEFTVILD